MLTRRVLLSLLLAFGLLATFPSLPHTTAASTTPSFPLSTNGSVIVDNSGKTVILQGVNWFGFETQSHIPHGLWTRDYKQMLAQIKATGFNTIRLPFSLQGLTASATSNVDFSNGKNAALAGKTPQQAMDIIIDEAAANGLMVILDNHSQADDGYGYDLWYGQNGYTETQWVNAWKGLATRYANKPNVIGADLKNEPHGSATWGTGAANDWRRAAELAGNAVLASNPKWLIFVEGIEGTVVGGQTIATNWWGGNLQGVKSNPVRLNVAHKLVYSLHEYGPEVYNQPWFSDTDMVSTLYSRWNNVFGYIQSSGTAPILVGEFGVKDVSTSATSGKWFRQFADYLSSKGISWTFWAWNPDSGDTGGILQDDWNTVNTSKMSVVTPLIQKLSISFPGKPSAIPPATVASSKGATTKKVTCRNTQTKQSKVFTQTSCPIGWVKVTH